jgi:hypothetical protein
MPPNPPPPDHQRPGRLPAGDMAAMAGRAPGSADPVHKRQLEKSVSWSGRERLRCLWYRLRLELADLNYASKRLVELQIPWIADPQWHTKTDPPLASMNLHRSPGPPANSSGACAAPSCQVGRDHAGGNQDVH